MNLEPQPFNEPAGMDVTEGVQASQNDDSEQSEGGSLVGNLGPNVNSFEIYLTLKIVLASLRDVSPFVALLKAVTALSTVRPNTSFQSNGSLKRVRQSKACTGSLIFSKAGIQIEVEYKRVLQGICRNSLYYDLD
jgi:hypothetical protein